MKDMSMLTRLAKAVFFGAYIVFNVLAPFMFRGIIRLSELLLRNLEIQGRMLEMAKGVLKGVRSATEDATRTSRKRRAG